MIGVYHYDFCFFAPCNYSLLTCNFLKTNYILDTTPTTITPRRISTQSRQLHEAMIFTAFLVFFILSAVIVRTNPAITKSTFAIPHTLCTAGAR